MTLDAALDGGLFAKGVVPEGAEAEDWPRLDSAERDSLEADLRALFARFPAAAAPNEPQTEDDLIWPVLARLGWTAVLRQQNLSPRGRADVPDGLLFADMDAKDRANGLPQEWRRYALGAALVESKRWGRPLDRASGRAGEETAPAAQMLRYLRRADDVTEGRLRWGVLTDGARWRLYWQGARSVSEDFFEIDLAAVLGVSEPGLCALDDADRRLGLELFALVFRREAFVPAPEDGRSFHARAVDAARLHRERVAADLSKLAFERVFPELAAALAAGVPDAPLPEVRDAALIFLYRLLFLFYAEDRGLLPVRDPRYGAYALRDNVRRDVGRRMDEGGAFSERAARYWTMIDDLCRTIDAGDESIGLPPYNGGLFDRSGAPLLARVRLGDAVVARIVDALSFRPGPDGARRYINYSELGVQQLGSIYERLLERELVRGDGGDVVVRLAPFARKDSGSYYTPDDLVRLVVAETLEPLARRRVDAFAEQARTLAGGQRRALEAVDPAEAILSLKVCDPAMGSGHFLVALVDWLADRAIAAMAEAESEAEGYVSPLGRRVAAVRETILGNAEARGWSLDSARLDDRHIVRRMALKRCVYGVDKNPMAVELAKVALWLHTFTVGAPLNFLDHHLRCGDSLFGSWVRGAIDRAEARGAPLLLHGPLERAAGAEKAMAVVEGLTDAEIEEADRSAAVFAEARARAAPLDGFLSLVHALDWLDLGGKADEAALRAFLDGQFGDPVAIALGAAEVSGDGPEAARAAEIIARARRLAAEERFLNWQAAFPGVWANWRSAAREGGFDAVIGNPPWERVKLEDKPWFAARRRPDIARAAHAADRGRMIRGLEKAGDPLAAGYARARDRAESAARMARDGGDYPLLSGGDVNLYSLFVERALAMVKPDGMAGLIVPSGIASDKTAAAFFKSVAAEGRLKALYDFENRKAFFPDVHASFKFCAFIASPSPLGEPAQYAFHVRRLAELEDPNRRFPLAAADFSRVNPNTGTAPVFRTRRDAGLTADIYRRLPILVDRTRKEPVKAWPVTYTRMFHMAGDSGLFRTREELEEKEGAWPVGDGRFDSPSGQWLPLYEGKMAQAYDHRASDVVVRPGNLFRSGQTEALSSLDKRDPGRLPAPRYYVKDDAERLRSDSGWFVAFKDVTAATNMRTMIAAIVPRVGAGHTLPVLLIDEDAADAPELACSVVANLNALVFDYVARQKVPTTHFTLYLLEQIPVVPPARYDEVRFGPRTAREIIRDAVLELAYTARDMAPFARDMGHVDESGAAAPPFPWDEARRLALRAKLDAVFFRLYGVTDRDDARYVYSTFPIVERQERARYGAYRSRDLCLAWMNALAAGEPDAEIDP